MKELIAFFIRNSKWFVFAILMVASTTMLVRTDPYHESIYLTSANSVSSAIYNTAYEVTSYFNLRSDNEDLNRRNAELQNQVQQLQNHVMALEEKIIADTITPFEPFKQYDFLVAHVINNSVMKPHNYLTINKGSEEGIRPEMGVIDQNGVVGVVSVVGRHSSRVISLLNPYLPLSCKIKNNDSFGSLVWDGADPEYAYLQELPRHTTFSKGDTVVTSGYSAVFPPGVPVGIVEESATNPNENFFSLKVRLLTDFAHLNNVQVVVNYMADELRAIQEDEKRLEEKENKK